MTEVPRHRILGRQGDAHFPLLQGFDPWIVLPLFVLLSISVLAVYSTTSVVSLEKFGTTTELFHKHTLHIGLGLLGMIGAAFIPATLLRRAALPFFLFALLLLIIVSLPGVGSKAGGAQRWLSLGPLRFQPGELIKVAVTLYTASYIGRHATQMGSFLYGCVLPLAVVGVVGMILLSQPDFGTTAICTAVVLFQIGCYCRLSHLFGMGALVASLGAMLIAFSPYRRERVVAFLNPLEDASGSGYQLTQSLIAVSNGGLTGRGLGAGSQKLFYLPAAHTDFIFAVICEELGFLGAVSILALFLAILFRGLTFARRASHTPFLVAGIVGFTMLLALPALLNIGVVIGLLPTKGLVLPLIGYGGTAMIASLISAGILFSFIREVREQ